MYANNAEKQKAYRERQKLLQAKSIASTLKSNGNKVTKSNVVTRGEPIWDHELAERLKQQHTETVIPTAEEMFQALAKYERKMSKVINVSHLKKLVRALKLQEMGHE